MKFSVIIPSYNSSQFIEEAIYSVVRQTYQDWEIIVMDNLSIDDTADKVKSIADKDGRIKFFSLKDKGIYDAMNLGVERASGDYLYFMGSDDRLHDDSVLSNMNDCIKDSSGLIYGDVIWQPDHILEKGEWDLKTLLVRNINHQRIFYRKSLFEKYGNYDIRFKVASDYQLNIRYFCNRQIKKEYVNIIVADYNAAGFSAGKTDLLFWEDWNKNVYQPFHEHLPAKTIHASKSVYVMHLISTKKYRKALSWTLDVFFKTYSFGFVLLMMKFAINSNQKNEK